MKILQILKLFTPIKQGIIVKKQTTDVNIDPKCGCVKTKNNERVITNLDISVEQETMEDNPII